MATFRPLRVMCVLIGLMACGASGNLGDPANERPEDVEMVRVIAKVYAPKGDVDAAALRQVHDLAKKLGARSIEPIEGLPLLVIELPQASLDDLEAAPQVESVQIDRPVPPTPAKP